MKPVSIVMPSYNKAKFINDAIQSVLAQTYTNWELIIVDDCSTDATKSILQTYANHPQITVCSESQQRGANYCRNKGLELSKGAYVLFFDADDILDKACITNRMEKFNSHPDCDFIVFPAHQFLENPFEPVNQLPAIIPGDPLMGFLGIHHSWQTSQLLWDKEFLLGIKGFDETFERFQDIELNTRALFNNPTYRMEDGACDVFVRVSRERMVMTHFDLCRKTTVSILKFCIKFQEESLKRYKKPAYLESLQYCSGILETYYRNQAISLVQYQELMDLMLNNKTIKKWNWLSKRTMAKQFKSLKTQNN